MPESRSYTVTRTQRIRVNANSHADAHWQQDQAVTRRLPAEADELQGRTQDAANARRQVVVVRCRHDRLRRLSVLLLLGWEKVGRS